VPRVGAKNAPSTTDGQRIRDAVHQLRDDVAQHTGSGGYRPRRLVPEVRRKVVTKGRRLWGALRGAPYLFPETSAAPSSLREEIPSFE
jgi:hypothetical protein